MSFVSMACWTVAAFTPPPGLPRQAAVRAAVPEATVRAATMHADGLAASAVQYTVALPMMYALLSAHEYMSHKYLMHLELSRPDTWVWLKSLIDRLAGSEKALERAIEANGHVEHHAETLDDMALRNDERWKRTPVAKTLDPDEWRGTAFNWQNFLIVAVTMPVYVIPTFATMGWSAPETMAIFLPCLLLQMLVWNALHPPMHGLRPVPAHVGPPSWVLADWLLESAYGKWLFENHMGHHVMGGRCNYNVVCPLADQLLGTYVPPEVWVREMRPVAEDANVRGALVAPAGVPKPPVCAVRAGADDESQSGVPLA